MSEASLLARLAQAYGVQPAYTDVWGKRVAPTADTQRALLRAMGVDAQGEAQVRDALRDVEERAWRELAPPVVALDEGAEVRIPVSAPAELAGRRLTWSLTEEGGGRMFGEADGIAVRAERDGRAQGDLVLPARPAAGYHDLTLELNGALAASVRLIVAPPRCLLPGEALGEDRVWGLAAQLYGVRSHRNWGMGDFSDLAQLAEHAAGEGAEFIGVNPLHALFPADARSYGPYRPSSRQLLNVLYVDPEAAPEIDGCPDAHALIGGLDMRDRLRHARDAELVDYAEVWALKLPVLERLFATFRARAADSPRKAAFEAFRRERGETLRRQALFDALQESFLREDPGKWSWRSWPETYRRADAPAVSRFAAERAERVEFHEYLQWLADEQFGAAQRRAREAGMRIGLYVDLAVGVHPEGATTWAFPEAAPTGASIGAPPDLLNQKGQNWGLSAPSPASLRATAYAHFADTLRESMRHAGAIRIDHALGLQRLFWIPDGAPPDAGAFVRYPFEDMLRVIRLESRRNRCLVVGEDLGTVPEGFQETMARAGVLSYRVLWFEQEDGAHKPPEEWPELAIAAVSTHDLPTALGFWLERDIDWRDRLDLHPTAEAGSRMREERQGERAMLKRLLGLAGDAEPEPAELVARLYAYVARTPSRLLAVQLEDILAEAEAPNLPGTTEEHPNWRRRLPLPIEELFQDPRARRVLDAVRAVRP